MAAPLTTREVSELTGFTCPHDRGEGIELNVGQACGCSSTEDGITCWDFGDDGQFSISGQAYHLS